MSIPITGTFQPTAGDNTFPLLEDVNFLGGFRAVPDHTARDAISALDRKQGMQVVTNNDGAIWALGSDLTTWTQVSQLTFAYVAAMAAIDATAVPDGTLASVGTVNAIYRIEKSPPSAVLAAVDAVNIVAATLPAGAIWARLGGLNQNARYQTDWYVDTATGSDAATGLLGAPLKTLGEVARRLQGVILQVSVTVHLAAGAYGACIFAFEFGAIDGILFLVIGTVSSSAAVALTGVTARNPLTSTRGQIQASTTFVDRTRLRLTSGAGSGATAEVTQVIGAGDCYVTAWGQISNVQFGTLLNTASPVVGDTFVVDTLLSSVSLIDMSCVSSLRGRVVIQDCNVRNVSPSPMSHRAYGNQSMTTASSSLIYRCNFSDAGGSSFRGMSCMIYCCSIDGISFVESGRVALGGGALRGALTVQEAGEVLQRGTCTFDGGRVVVNGGFWSSNGIDVEFCDAAGGIAFQVTRGGRVFCNGGSAPWWSANTSFVTGVSVGTGSCIAYTTVPTVSAVTQQVLLGGVAQTYSAVNTPGGLVNAVNGACMAVLT